MLCKRRGREEGRATEAGLELARTGKSDRGHATGVGALVDRGGSRVGSQMEKREAGTTVGGQVRVRRSTQGSRHALQASPQQNVPSTSGRISPALRRKKQEARPGMGKKEGGGQGRRVGKHASEKKTTCRCARAAGQSQAPAPQQTTG